VWRFYLDRLFPGRRRQNRRTQIRRSCRPSLEILEDRLAPAVFTVPGDFTSLGAAITVGVGSSTDLNNTIVLASGTFGVVNQQISLASNGSLTIVGQGSNQTILTAANQQGRVLEVVAGTVSLQDLTITGGNVQGMNTALQGGGLLIDGGNVALSNVAVRTNVVHGLDGIPGSGNYEGGPGTSAAGGGIYLTAGKLTLVNSTISNNQVFGGKGGDGGPVEGLGGSGGSALGGGLYVKAGTVIGEGVSIQGNQVKGGDGGQGYNGNGGWGGDGGTARGAGFYAEGGTITLFAPASSPAAVTGNRALGGVGGHGGYDRDGTSANGGQGGDGGSAQGGGAYVGSGAQLSLVGQPLKALFAQDKVVGGAGGTGSAGRGFFPVKPGGKVGHWGGNGGDGGAGFGGGIFDNGVSINGYGGGMSNCRASGGHGGRGGSGANVFGTSGSEGGRGGDGGAGGDGAGGGVYVLNGSLTLYQAALANDSAAAGTGGNGGNGGNGGSGIHGQGKGQLHDTRSGSQYVRTAYGPPILPSKVPFYFATGAGGGGPGGAGGQGGAGGDALGGGCYLFGSGVLTLVASTLTGDAALGGPGGDGGRGGDGNNGGSGPNAPAIVRSASSSGGAGGFGGVGGSGGDGGKGGKGGYAYGGGVYVSSLSSYFYAGAISGIAMGGAGGTSGDGGAGGAAGPGGKGTGRVVYYTGIQPFIWPDAPSAGGGDGGDCTGGDGGDARGGGLYLATYAGIIPVVTVDGVTPTGEVDAGAGGAPGVPGAGGAGANQGTATPGSVGTRADANIGNVANASIQTQSPYTAAKLMFSPMPPSVVSGAPFPYPVYVIAADNSGNVAGDFTGQINLLDNAPNSPGNPDTEYNMLGGTPHMQAVNGVAVFSDLSVKLGARYGVGGPTLLANSNELGGASWASATFTVIGYAPDQIRQAYGIDALGVDAKGHPLDGTGQTLAIVDAYHDPNIFLDVDMFDSQFGLMSNGPTLFDQYGAASTFLSVRNPQGGTDLPNTNPPADWAEEIALDVDWAHVIAPGAKIVLIESDPSSDSVDSRIAAWLAGVDFANQLAIGSKTIPGVPAVSVVSMSFGWTESKLETSDDVKFQTPGVTYVAASGDSGSPGLYPAYSPYVVAVGGTSLWLHLDNSYLAASGWKGSGGGISAYESKPAYQSSVTQSSTNRTSPDVAFVADPGVAVYDSCTYPFAPWRTTGGTSLAAPCWAGLIAIIDQGRQAAGQPVLNSTGGPETLKGIYHLGLTSPQDFNDITTGSNGAYQAGPGYDLVTGWGTPRANLLVPDLIDYGTLRITPSILPEGTAGVHYHQVITATNDFGKVTVLLTLPTGAARLGLTFTVHSGNPGTVTIDGTPDAGGTIQLTGTATDSAGQKSELSYTLTMNPALRLDPYSVPAGTVGVAYNEIITTTGGTGTKKMIYKPPAKGTTLAALGLQATPSDGDPGTLIISGTPTARGVVIFTLSATDEAGAVAPVVAYILEINPPVTLGQLSTTTWTQNQPGYSATIQVKGGTKPYDKSSLVVDGLPDKLEPSLDPKTGIITIAGTPTEAGSFNVSVTVEDEAGATASASYTLTINPPVTLGSLSTTAWTEGQAGYSATIQVSGGTLPYANKLQVRLPAGLHVGSFDTTTGVLTIKGRPTTTVNIPNNVQVHVTDAIGAFGSATYTLTINPPVTPGPLSTTVWTQNQAGYSGTITVSGGTKPYDDSSLEVNGLPAGLDVASFDTTTGVITITGTPTEAVNIPKNVHVAVEDDIGAAVSASYTLVINPTIALGSLSSTVWTQNHSGYSGTIKVKGGTRPYDGSSLQVTGLPAGLEVASFDTLTGTITIAGTPTVAVASPNNVSVTVQDQVGASGSGTYTLLINPVVSLSPSSVASGTVGTAYSQTITASGGTGAKTVHYGVVAGKLPAGLKISSSSGDPATLTLAGTPTAKGTVILKVTATDSIGASTQQSYIVTIAPQSGLVDAPTITGISPSTGSTAGGTKVTITGTNLIGAIAVEFSDKVVTHFTSDTMTKIVVTSPPDAVGTVDVRVVTAIGPSATTSADQFQYVQPPIFIPVIGDKHLSPLATINFPHPS